MAQVKTVSTTENFHFPILMKTLRVFMLGRPGLRGCFCAGCRRLTLVFQCQPCKHFLPLYQWMLVKFQHHGSLAIYFKFTYFFLQLDDLSSKHELRRYKLCPRQSKERRCSSTSRLRSLKKKNSKRSFSCTIYRTAFLYLCDNLSIYRHVLACSSV